MHIQNRLISIENKLVMVTKKETEMGEGQIKGLGLTDVRYCIYKAQGWPLACDNLEYNLQKYWISMVYT